MKTNFKIAWLIALLAGMPLLLSAQEKDRSSLPREVLSPEKVAKRETDEMKKQLQLTEKQYKNGLVRCRIPNGRILLWTDLTAWAEDVRR